MAPRKEARHEGSDVNGMVSGVRGPEQAAMLEAAIRQIPGVASVSVDCGADGEVTAIDILVEGRVQSRRIVRDVESACTAHLGRRLPLEAVSITRGRSGSARSVRQRALVPERLSRATSGAMGTLAPDAPQSPVSGDAARAGGVRVTVSGESGEGRAPEDAGQQGADAKAPAVKKYRVVSGAGTASPGGDKPREGWRARTSGDEEMRPEPRIGLKRLGVNVYSDRIHAVVELSYGPRTFTGEEDDLPNEDNRFRVPAAAALKALDKAFGGLVGLSVDDVQLCRLSGRETAVVLATIGSPWGDVPSTGASYVTRSEEEAVIRALLHAVNRCVTLTYGGEEFYDEDVG
ncbi:MAG: hypothetical protein ACM3X3_10375 [Betaproteobacteria bacterium]